MIVSPPFLPIPDAGETDATYLDRAMLSGGTADGSYPVTSQLSWHGGVHLSAPAADGGGVLPVRAISDGTVVFVRKPTPRSTDKAHPLNYRGGWTDDGCVVVRHQTEIGGDGARNSTTVAFFSIYMHLATVADGLASGKAIYRTDVVGTPGSIYGTPNRLHFEIVCDDANCRALTGRKDAFNDTTLDGRTDAVFGAIYFFLLTSTEFFSSNPQGQGAQTNPVVYTNREAHWVRMQFVGTSCRLETLHLDGTPLGEPIVENGFVTSIVANATTRFPNSPSAGVDMLRFGRVLGPDALDPADSPHWRKVRIPNRGEGWVDLNARRIKRFSEADFPFWEGWRLVDATASTDSRVREQAILELLDRNRQGTSPTAVQQALDDATVQTALRRKICKFQTEWDAAAIDKGYAWMKSDSNIHMPDDDLARLKAHLTALSFWDQAKLGIGSTPWHFHGRAFLELFRKCGWLSQNELAQCIPRRDLKLSGTTFAAQTVANWNTASTRAGQWKNALNAAARKYLVSTTPQRLIHFLAQVFEESGFLHFVKEGDGERASYAPWYGRGLIQLTHLENYQAYGRYRGFPTNEVTAGQYRDLGWDPDVRIALNNRRFDAANCADSAGFFWVQHDALAVSDRGLTTRDVVSVSKLINGNFSEQILNGLDIRQESVVQLRYVLLDLVRPSNNTEQLSFVWRRSSRKEGSPPRFRRANHDIEVPLAPQRP